MSAHIIAPGTRVCHLCHGTGYVPDTDHRGGIEPCPGCDDDPAGGAALPAGPVGHLEVWAVSADEGACRTVAGPIAPTPTTLRIVREAADRMAPRLADSDGFGGGTVRVCDAAGNEWHRVAIPAAGSAAA